MELPNRKTLRLKGYDYCQPGGYFVTLCTEKRRCIFSTVAISNEMDRAQILLTELGQIAYTTVHEVTQKYGIEIDSFIIMPNHIHLIIFLGTNPHGKSVGQLVGAYKSLVAKHWRDICNTRGVTSGKIWQRNYYEHVLRNDQDYLEKLRYIDENPDKWHEDDMYVKNGSV